MKNLIMSAIILGMSVMHVNAQGIGINATGASPDNSAILDVESPTGAGMQMGILFPRVNLVTGITAPATNLFGVNTNPAFNAGSRFNSGLGLYRFNGIVWNRLLESTDSTMFWGTQGNTIVSGDFIGSTNSSGTLPLEFKVNNITRLTIPTNAASGYITASNIVGFRAPASSVPATSVYSIGSSFEFGLSGNPGTSGYTALRFGTTSFLTGLNTVGVGISIAGNPTPTEVLDVDGNIFTRGKIIYNELANSSEKTFLNEIHWSGTIALYSDSPQLLTEGTTFTIVVRRDTIGGVTKYFLKIATSTSRTFNCIDEKSEQVVSVNSLGPSLTTNRVPINFTNDISSSNGCRIIYIKEPAKQEITYQVTFLVISNVVSVMIKRFEN